MKRKSLLTILALSLVSVLVSGGIVYAAWINTASNTGNTVKIGSEVVISLDKADGEKYFENVELSGPGAETDTTKISVITAGDQTTAYSLSVTAFTLSGEDTPEYTADELYIKIANTEGGLESADAVKFADGVTLLASGVGDRDVYIVIGIAQNAQSTLAGRTVTFAIGTAVAE